MIHLIILGPLAVAGGGLVGLAHERFRRKRLSEQLAFKEGATGAEPSAQEQEAQILATDDPVELKYSTRAAYLSLGMATVGAVAYPPLAFMSLPVLGYSVYNWLHARYPTERTSGWAKSPSTILTMVAIAAAVLSGLWLLAPLALAVDLAFRKRWASDKYEMLHKQFVEKARKVLRFGLTGEKRWEWLPILIARVSLGLFFALSGWNKLFQAANWNNLVIAMVGTGLPYPHFLSYFLASVELYGGSLLAIGFLSTIWAIMLAFAMLVAIITVEIPHVIPPGLGPLDWTGWFLYLPQVMYVIIFLWLIIRGPGPVSIDAMIAREFGLDKEPGDPADDDSVVLTVDKTPELAPA